MYLFLLLYLSFGYENAPACQNCNRSHQNQSGCRKPALKSRLQRSTHSSIAEVLTQKSDKSSVHRTRSFQFMFFISIKYVNWMIPQLSYYVNRNSIFFKSFCARLDTPTARAAGFPALLFVNPRLKIICGPRAMNRCGPHLEELFYTHRFPCRFVWPFPAPHSDPSANVFSSAIAITVPYPICWPSPGPGQSEIHPAGYGPESLRGSQCPAYPESCCLSCAFHHHDHVAITSCVKDLWQRLSNMNRKRQVLMISTIHAFW